MVVENADLYKNSTTSSIQYNNELYNLIMDFQLE